MGKLKEKLLNNLTPEEQEEMFGLSAFEYVEYMENYKTKSEEIPTDVIEQLGEEQQRLEQEYYEQELIDSINESNKLKYTDDDILYVLDGMVDPQKMDIIMAKFRDVWNIKNGFFE